MTVKVCGMRDAENIREVTDAGVGMMGFIFAKESPRYVGELPVFMPALARVGVFVNPAVAEVTERVRQFSLDYVQLHGTESPELCRTISLCCGTRIIKSFGVGDTLPDTEPYEGIADMFLFDTACTGGGGSGKSFNWDLLRGYRGRTRFLLGGGIGPDSVEAIRAFSHPLLAGVEINSRFETSPGIKDAALISKFIQQL